MNYEIWKMINVTFSKNAWEDYLYWQNQDRKNLKRINRLIEDIARNNGKGIGKGELLKENLSGFCSKRIDGKNRLVYKLDKNSLYIIQCKNHYND